MRKLQTAQKTAGDFPCFIVVPQRPGKNWKYRPNESRETPEILAAIIEAKMKPSAVQLGRVFLWMYGASGGGCKERKRATCGGIFPVSGDGCTPACPAYPTIGVSGRLAPIQTWLHLCSPRSIHRPGHQQMTGSQRVTSARSPSPFGRNGILRENPGKNRRYNPQEI